MVNSYQVSLTQMLAVSMMITIQSVDPSPLPASTSSDVAKTTTIVYTAIVNVTYRDPITGDQKYECNDGWFSSENLIGPGWGWLHTVRSANNRTDGCDPIVNRVEGPWVALVERGRCRFHQKIYNAAVVNNASAVIVYNNEHEPQVLNMQHKVEDVVSIFLRRNDGLRLIQLMENGTRVFITISPGSTYFSRFDAPSRSSVIFLFISFVVLAVISLLWLIFYYVQRFRIQSTLTAERQRKNKIAKRLTRAAKSVVSKMEQKFLKDGDTELTAELQLCAICVEEYFLNDNLRILPCRHSFHKKCVDQWLFDKRRCPICQLDILKAAGIQIPEEYQTLNNGRVDVPESGNNNNPSRSSFSNDNNNNSGNFDSVACSETDCVMVSNMPSRTANVDLTTTNHVGTNNAESSDIDNNNSVVAANVADNISCTTYHSNDSLAVFVINNKNNNQFNIREENLSSLLSSSSSIFDIQEKSNTAYNNNNNNNDNNNDNNNNNASSTESGNSTIAILNSRHDRRSDADDESRSSSISHNRYYDCSVIIGDDNSFAHIDIRK